MEPINREYNALRMACPFLDQETCSIYDHRPAACRELLVTTPPALCDDLINNPVRPLPVPIRVGPALALLWSEFETMCAHAYPASTRGGVGTCSFR
jgi:Fe-S-cluster containining protein